MEYKLQDTQGTALSVLWNGWGPGLEPTLAGKVSKCFFIHSKKGEILDVCAQTKKEDGWPNGIFGPSRGEGVLEIENQGRKT